MGFIIAFSKVIKINVNHTFKIKFAKKIARVERLIRFVEEKSSEDCNWPVSKKYRYWPLGEPPTSTTPCPTGGGLIAATCPEAGSGKKIMIIIY